MDGSSVDYSSTCYAFSERVQYDLAIADCDKAIELDPNLPLAYKEQGKKVEAIADFEKFITLTGHPEWIEMAQQHIEELKE